MELSAIVMLLNDGLYVVRRRVEGHRRTWMMEVRDGSVQRCEQSEGRSLSPYSINNWQYHEFHCVCIA